MAESMTKPMAKSFEELAQDKDGTVYVREPLKTKPPTLLVILKGPASLCAYVGIPASHPMAGKDYDHVDLDVHGGLTYSDAELINVPEDKYYWYGWDYAHGGDKSFYELSPTIREMRKRLGVDFHIKDHGWTVPDVYRDAYRILPSLRKLLKGKK